MGSFSEDEEVRFFDAQEDIPLASSSNSDGFELFDSNAISNHLVTHVSQYDVWVQSPGSVKERRNKFLNWMDVKVDQIVQGDSSYVCGDVMEREVDRIMESSGAVLRNSGFAVEFCSIRSSMSCEFSENIDSSEELRLKENYACRQESSNCGTDCYMDEPGQGREKSECKEAAVDKDFRNTPALSPSFNQPMQSETEEGTDSPRTMKRVKKGWLERFRSFTRIVDRRAETENRKIFHCNSTRGARVQRVRVHQSRKRLKELSAVYQGQDIMAHEGSILSMKFSPDGQYLASAGEDGIVRVWKVVEDERSNEHDIPEIDPSCIYFTVNHLSELTPLCADNEKMSKVKIPRKASDSACVIFPPKVFRILEKPLHEFQGHTGEILDLSWSKNKYLLSSSVDKTVRLWRVGNDHCVKVFSHSNFVTCVQFNPVSDNYFISGSIDGKVRVWEISCCQVVDWTDIREIVTAVCYRPNGQGGIVGSMTGNCRFYTVSDNHLQLDAQIPLHNKKKSPCKRITGFEFFPHDYNKVIVTCADSHVRILDGHNMIGKYKGVRSAGNQMSASFTSDGKHIVSAGEDSNVYVWNCGNQEELALSQAKTIRSWERFSANASIAIPWCGLRHCDTQDGWQFHALDEKPPLPLLLSSPACFSLTQEFSSEFFAKGSATWPEEKLPASSPLSTLSTLHRSQYKFLKNSCQSTSTSPAWGLVIVTAGLDGRIKSFHNYGLPIHL